MDRKGIIGIAISIAVLIIWQINYSRELDQYQRAKAAADAAAKARQTEEQQRAATAAPAPATPAAPTAPVTPAAALAQEPPAVETTGKLASPAAEYTFTNLGGGIARAVLLKHKAEGDTRVTLNEFGPTPIGAVSERAGEETQAPFTASVDAAAGEATFERTDARQFQMVKKFTLPKSTGLREEYLVQLELSFTNRGAQAIKVPGYYVHTGSAGPVHRLDQPLYTGFNWFRDGANTFRAATSFTTGGVLGMGSTEQPIFTQTLDGIGWAGVTNQYFATILTPASNNAKASALWARKFSSPAALPNANPQQSRAQMPVVEGALGMAGFTLEPGATATQRFELYAGPRETKRLKSLGQQQDEIMDFGWFAVISKTLLASMNWLNSKLGSYAAAIIVLTIIIRGLMWPLQNKATNSMKKMAALQPKMTELREKYKDDPQRMNQEVMRLYKDYQINPVSGCLPILVQIPIFFGFYNMLGKAVELRNSRFLWVDDLSLPDTIWTIPGLGFPLNILPLLMAVTMFWQMAISPKTGDVVQQRVFMFMPLIFIFFCYNFASALALYWTVQNIFSIVQLYLTRNQATPVLQKVAAPVKKKGR